MIHILSAEILRDIADAHVAIFGKTRVGKSMLLEALAEAIAKNPLEGFTFICPHGTARAVAERLANPANGCHGRRVHVLDPSSSMVFGANPFETYDDSWDACHDAALLWTSSVASNYGTAMHETPRLETNLYVLGMFAAHKKLTLTELLPALSLAGAEIREFLLSNFNNHAVAGVLADLHELAARQPARFLEQIDSWKNRHVRWLGDKRLGRIFGQQKGLNARAVMDDRDIVLVDLSTLAQEDADFLATILVCRYFAAAKRRPPHACARHRIIIDEAAGSLCTATAQLLDQCAKFGLLGIFSLQRVSQLEEKGEFITGALMVNTGVKIVFNTPEAISARMLAENIFTGYVDLQEWKPASVRPVAVGNDKVTIRGRSQAEHAAHAESSADTDMRSWARASAAMNATMFSSGAAFGSGENLSFASMPADQVLAAPTLLSKTSGRNSASNSSSARGLSSGRSSSRQYARGRARTDARASTEGASSAESESEAFVTRYEDLPTQMFSLEEQLHRLTGEIMTLPRRECFVRLEGHAPFRARTADVQPAFRSIEFRAEMLPRYLQTVAQRSAYLVPADQVDAEIAARLQAITTAPSQPGADFTAPEPMPNVVDAPQRYAREFWNRKSQKPDEPPGRPPVGELGDKHKHLRVVDGTKDEGDNSR